MMANNERACAAGGRDRPSSRVKPCLFHTDAVQAAGKVLNRLKEIGCELLSISGHKMHARRDWSLYVRKGTLIEPLSMAAIMKRHGVRELKMWRESLAWEKRPSSRNRSRKRNKSRA